MTTPAPAPPPPRPTFVVVLEAMPTEEGQPPPEARLKLLLKDAGRRYRLKCIDMADVPAGQTVCLVARPKEPPA
jgi:hypothetical protein